jgi:ATP-dependent RNA helicase DDX46/PRP5
MNLRVSCTVGGQSISDDIAAMKKGAEIVVCTPGRMIDLLTANNGRVTNLRRTTMLVMDEADRMFDMGFEPQVMKIISNTRPDAQGSLLGNLPQNGGTCPQNPRQAT